MTGPYGLRYELIATFIRFPYAVAFYTLRGEAYPLCPMHASVPLRWFCSPAPF
jgi:hypothetical protein